MSWPALLFHPLARSLGTLVLVAVLGLALSQLRHFMADDAMEAIDEAESAAYAGPQRLHLELTGGLPVSEIGAQPSDPEAAPVLPAMRRCHEPKKVRTPSLDI